MRHSAFSGFYFYALNTNTPLKPTFQKNKMAEPKPQLEPNSSSFASDHDIISVTHDFFSSSFHYTEVAIFSLLLAIKKMKWDSKLCTVWKSKRKPQWSVLWQFQNPSGFDISDSEFRLSRQKEREEESSKHAKWNVPRIDSYLQWFKPKTSSLHNSHHTPTLYKQKEPILFDSSHVTDKDGSISTTFPGPVLFHLNLTPSMRKESVLKNTSWREDFVDMLDDTGYCVTTSYPLHSYKTHCPPIHHQWVQVSWIFINLQIRVGITVCRLACPILQLFVMI